MKINRIYYLILSFFSLLIFVFTFLRSPREIRRYILPLFLAFTGLNYIFEYYVLVKKKAYRYYPKILNNPYFDNVLGANISQLFVVPTVGILISILNINNKWLFSVLITLIEKLFTEKGIFKNRKWSTFYTLIGLQLFFTMAKEWRKQLIEKNSNIFKLSSVLLSIFVVYSTLLFYAVSIFKTFLFKVKIYRNPYRSHVDIATIYSAFYSFIIFLCLIYQKLHVRILGLLSLFALDLYLIKLKVIKVSNNIYYIFSPLIKLISMLIGSYIHRMLYKEKEKLTLS